MVNEGVPHLVEEFVKELVCNGYMVTYLGDESNTGESRLVLTGHTYRVEVKCRYQEEPYQYKVEYKLVNSGGSIDVGLLDDLRDIIEPNIESFVEWLAKQEPFAYVYKREEDKIKGVF